MTILWCGNEDIDFTISSSSPFQSDSVFNGINAGWLHFSLYINYREFTNFNLCGLKNKSTQKGIYIAQSSVPGRLCLCANDTVIATEEGNSAAQTTTIDMNIISLGSSASIKVYSGGSEIINYTGDLSSYSISDLDSVWFSTGPFGVFEVAHSPIVADEDTRLFVLATLRPNAEGDTSANWTGSYTDIDETTISDSDKIYSSTPDADFQCGVTGMPSGSWVVKAVKVAVRCVDGSGTNGIAVGVKTNDTVSVSGAMSCSGYWQTKELMLNINPVTGNPWTPAEIEALQLNLRCMAV